MWQSLRVQGALQRLEAGARQRGRLCGAEGVRGRQGHGDQCGRSVLQCAVTSPGAEKPLGRILENRRGGEPVLAALPQGRLHVQKDGRKHCRFWGTEGGLQRLSLLVQ